ncbi:MAG TPA: UDP-N-acetylmuramoyl-L-alanyl-D-glutamate--2,6-diaminopimelate ligase [Candidatus Limnocylindrales bacterium]
MREPDRETTENETDISPADTVSRSIAAADLLTARPFGELVARLAASGRLAVGGPALAVAPALASLPISGITSDSRRAAAGFVFVAVPGAHVDGRDFVAAAAANGVSAAVVEQVVPEVDLPQVVVDDASRALAVAAAWRFGDPSRELGIVGITGTDGKTTTSFLATAVLEAAGISTGLITTAGKKIGSVRTANVEHVTTPEAPQIQRMLRAMVLAGNEAAIVETTSHGLALHRVDEIAYDIAIFTNLTHEHLELHGTFEAYREAKLSLFERLGEADGAGRNDAGSKATLRRWPRTAIVNADDPAASLFAAAARRAGAEVLTYGESAGADVRATTVREGVRALEIEVATRRGGAGLSLALVGRFNVLNCLAAIALGEVLGLDPEPTWAALEAVTGVPGRMDRVDCGQPFGVIVDYAHSPASLQKVLETLAPMAAAGGGGVVAVFGSAGERDVQKRPMMGRVAGERCRLVIVTDEDPRGEDNLRILSDIAAGAEAAGMRKGENLLCIADRREAIEAAFASANPGDIVLLAGKGHEQSIIMAEGPRSWDERSEAVRALGRLGYRRR